MAPNSDRQQTTDGERLPTVLLYGMYELRRLDRAPEVRISLLADALRRQAHLDTIVGGRLARARSALAWLAAGRWRSTDAVYVELPSSVALPSDIAFMAVLRLLRLPVGVYFRDAYQLHRDLFPVLGARQRMTDLAWRITLPLVRALATRRFAPSAGLAAELGLREAVLLPPGTDPGLPDLGIGERDLVAAIVSIAPRTGFETLLAAVDHLRATRPGVRLRVVAANVDHALAAALPPWVDVVSGGRASLAVALAPARVCVLPLPVTAYTHLAVPMRLMDLLAFGKPIVSTASHETAAILAETGAGLACPDTVPGLAAAILAVLEDDSLARTLAAHARAAALSPERTWSARSRQILETLLPADRGRT